jgi:hypothetical protein
MAVKFLKSAHQIATQELGPGLSSALGVRRCYRRGLRRIAEEAASPSAKQSKAKHGTAQGVPIVKANQRPNDEAADLSEKRGVCPPFAANRQSIHH